MGDEGVVVVVVVIVAVAVVEVLWWFGSRSVKESVTRGNM